LVENESVFTAEGFKRVSRLFCRPDVKSGRPDRDEAEINHPHHRRGGGGIGPGRINDGESVAVPGKRPQGSFQLHRSDRVHDWGFCVARLAPALKRALRVHVDQEHPFLGFLRSDAEAGGESAFPGTPFLSDKGDCVHCLTLNPQTSRG